MVCLLLFLLLDLCGLVDINVYVILVDSCQWIWFGLGGGQIDLVDLYVGSIYYLQLDGVQQYCDVQVFVEMLDGSIWVGMMGLVWIDLDMLVIISNVELCLVVQLVLSMLQVDGIFLFGIYVGVYCYMLVIGVLDYFCYDVVDFSLLVSDMVCEIVCIDGCIWYGIIGGISVVDDVGVDSGFCMLSQCDGDCGNLFQDYIGLIIIDFDGGLWIVIFGGVVYLFSSCIEGMLCFYVLGMCDGLSSEKVNVLLFDVYGYVWVSFLNGVLMIDCVSGVVYNLGVCDGLYVFSYIYIVVVMVLDGVVMFGGLGGFIIVCYFCGDVLVEFVLVFLIIVVCIGCKVIVFGVLLQWGEILWLDGDNCDMQVGFVVLDYCVMLEIIYSYWMEGFDQSWIEVFVGSLFSVVYINLFYGQYMLYLCVSMCGMYLVMV